MRQVDLTGVVYHGVDISSFLIQTLNQPEHLIHFRNETSVRQVTWNVFRAVETPRMVVHFCVALGLVRVSSVTVFLV
jgi:hypothetical protein